MKELLSDKYTTLQKNLIGMISKKAKSEGQVLFNSFTLMEQKLKEQLQEIEKLADIKDYIATLPMEMDRMRVETIKVFEICTILEDFKEKTSKD